MNLAVLMTEGGSRDQVQLAIMMSKTTWMSTPETHLLTCIKTSRAYCKNHVRVMT